MKYTPQQYAQALLQSVEKAPAKEHSRLVKNFVQVLLRNNDTPLWKQISHELERLYNEKHGIKNVLISAATAPEANGLNRTFSKKRFRVLETVDPTLYGGAIIRVGDMMVDNTVRSRISELRTALTR